MKLKEGEKRRNKGKWKRLDKGRRCIRNKIQMLVDQRKAILTEMILKEMQMIKMDKTHQNMNQYKRRKIIKQGRHIRQV